MDRLTQFKNRRIGPFSDARNGSCGDIAASCYGGWLAFPHLIMSGSYENKQEWTLTQLLTSDWPELDPSIGIVPKSLRLLIGWTGSPASTSDLVDQVYQSKEAKEKGYAKVLARQQRLCDNRLIDGF